MIRELLSEATMVHRPRSGPKREPPNCLRKSTRERGRQRANAQAAACLASPKKNKKVMEGRRKESLPRAEKSWRGRMLR